ncbi:MAG: DUF4199 domain-containing protein [Limisphaerales bacterium]
MSPTNRIAAKWGLFIGLTNLVWLYLAYFLGLHTSGIMVFQIFMLVWLALTVTGFILALRAVKRQKPSLSFLGGIGAGAATAVVSAIVAVVAQVGYFTVVHPAWPEVMAQQTKAHFTAQGMSPAQVERMVVQARGSFTLSNYAVSSAATALIVGIVLSAIIMLFLRRRSAAATPEATRAAQR